MATTVHLTGVQGGWVPPTDQQNEPHAVFGDWLKQARETSGLTLDDIARRTNIPQRHLEALEQGHLGGLPEFYQRAEVRAFAREIGMDEQLALTRLQSVTTSVEAQGEPPRQAPREQPAHQPSIVTVPLAIGAAILTAGLFAWGIFGRTVASEGAAGSPPIAVTRVQNDAAGTATTQSVAVEVDPGRSDSGRSKDLPLQVTGSAVPQLAHASVAPGHLPAATTTDVPVSTGAVTELVITTQPPGARVTVNGIGWGLSPLAIQHLPAGYKLIRVSKDGYAATERVLALDEGLRRSLNIRLTTAR
jgi:cytoskeleton protein RodZ